jgi:pimeloyl-ACP methyl ester carboxylesterase
LAAGVGRPGRCASAARAQITAPSLVLGGGPSSHIDQAELAAVAAAVPDCQLVTIPDAGHSIHARRPAEFLAAVVPFLT